MHCDPCAAQVHQTARPKKHRFDAHLLILSWFPAVVLGLLADFTIPSMAPRLRFRWVYLFCASASPCLASSSAALTDCNSCKQSSAVYHPKPQKPFVDVKSSFLGMRLSSLTMIDCALKPRRIPSSQIIPSASAGNATCVWTSGIIFELDHTRQEVRCRRMEWADSGIITI